MTLERRVALELRAQGRTLSGYAAKFGTEARIADFVETISPGAFRQSLQSGTDVLALRDHDAGQVLGRTKSGTLVLTEDSVGLRYELSVADTQAGRDLITMAERHDLGGCSFGFIVPPGGDSWNGNKRTLRSVDLREISIVSAWPAYPSTTVNARSRTPELNRVRLFMETLGGWRRND